MVNTRTEILRENRVEQSENDKLSDNDDSVSVADHNRESYFGENDDETIRSMEKDHERLRIEQRFIGFPTLSQLTERKESKTKPPNTMEWKLPRLNWLDKVMFIKPKPHPPPTIIMVSAMWGVVKSVSVWLVVHIQMKLAL